MVDKKRLLLYLATGFMCFFADRITKWLILKFATALPILVFPGFKVILVFNKGVCFGFLNSFAGEWATIFIFVLLFFVILFAYFMFLKHARGYSVLGEILILSGAISNLTDRFLYGHVIDFLDFYYKGWHWPAFNLADSFIVIGLALLAWRVWNVEFKLNGI